MPNMFNDRNVLYKNAKAVDRNLNNSWYKQNGYLHTKQIFNVSST